MKPIAILFRPTGIVHYDDPFSRKPKTLCGKYYTVLGTRKSLEGWFQFFNGDVTCKLCKRWKVNNLKEISNGES